MTSPLELRLSKEVDALSDPVAKAAKRCELACYWARVGRMDEAEAVRVELRGRFGDGAQPEVSIFVMFLEGLMHYFRDMNVNSRDRIARAALLSGSFELSRLAALTNAWLSQIEFNFCKYDSMTIAIEKCLASIAEDDGNAECRLSLVLGAAFLFCGQRSESQDWYERARLSGSLLGDHSAIGALTYNRAALRAREIRLLSMGSELSDQQIRFASLELNSAVNYQAIAQLMSLGYLLDTSRVSLLVAERRYEAAKLLTEELMRRHAVPQFSPEYPVLLADKALCDAKLGLRVEAAEGVLQSISSVTESMQPDDRAIVFDSLSKCMEALGDQARKETFGAQSSAALQAHQGLIDDLKPRIARFADVKAILGSAPRVSPSP